MHVVQGIPFVEDLRDWRPARQVCFAVVLPKIAPNIGVSRLLAIHVAIRIAHGLYIQLHVHIAGGSMSVEDLFTEMRQVSSDNALQ